MVRRWRRTSVGIRQLNIHMSIDNPTTADNASRYESEADELLRRYRDLRNALHKNVSALRPYIIWAIGRCRDIVRERHALACMPRPDLVRLDHGNCADAGKGITEEMRIRPMPVKNLPIMTCAFGRMPPLSRWALGTSRMCTPPFVVSESHLARTLPIRTYRFLRPSTNWFDLWIFFHRRRRYGSFRYLRFRLTPARSGRPANSSTTGILHMQRSGRS